MNIRENRLAAFERQEQRLERRLQQLNYWSTRYWTIQIAIFIGGILITFIALAIARWLGILVALLAVGVFWLAIRNHRKVDTSIVKHQVRQRMIKAQIARMQLDWSGIPSVPERAEHTDHPFDVDLDISGACSLHQLINTGVSFEGTMRLRDWLLSTTPDLATIYQRQARIEELVPMSGFRNKFMFHSLFATRYSQEQLEGGRLRQWLEDAEEPASLSTLRSIFFVGVALSAATLLLVLLYVLSLVPPWACVIPLLLSLVWYISRRKEQGNVLGDASYLRQTVSQLRSIFEYLETYRYGKHQRLKELCEPFYLHSDYRPSLLLKQFSRLASMAALTSTQEGAFFLNTLLPWDAYIAYQLHRYKEQLARRLPAWLDAWYELEALCSLANFAYLNPQYTFPQVVDCKGQDAHITFQGKALGHPLIAEGHKVVNDFQLHHLGDIAIITGSNMAGKSTFLRTLGINLCLAYAGASVNASNMRLSLFELYACIKVSDSVTDGYSYFYAEVRRLKGLLARLEQGTRFPLFFLIDEIFKGTNNYERLIGSAAYIYALAEKKCAGVISTHDLELVKLADELPLIENYHFREKVIDGKMAFDYKMRPGPSPTRNALKIMAIEGLPVSIPTESNLHSLL